MTKQTSALSGSRRSAPTGCSNCTRTIPPSPGIVTEVSAKKEHSTDFKNRYTETVTGGGMSKTRREFIQATGSMALAAALASKLTLSRPTRRYQCQS
jgi:hypothetical protein